MKYRDENGDFQDLYFKTGDTLPIGTIVSYGSLTPPTNWLVCDGSAVSRTTYADLFATIGTTYGSGDGSTTFNLPDLRGRVPVGKSTDTEFDTLGETGGEKAHTLTIDEIPSHNHSITIHGTASSGTMVAQSNGNGGSTTGIGWIIGNTGGGQAHNILQPYQVVCFIIKAEDAAGVVGNVTNTASNSTTDTYSCDYINNKMQTVYDDETGSNASFSLSKSVANAKFYIVQYRQEGYSGATKTDIVFPGEQKHQLFFSHRELSGGAETLYNVMTYIGINGQNITVQSSSTGIAVNPNTSYGVASNTIYITKVIAVY